MYLKAGLHRGEDPVQAFAKGGDSEEHLIALLSFAMIPFCAKYHKVICHAFIVTNFTTCPGGLYWALCCFVLIQKCPHPADNFTGPGILPDGQVGIRVA